MNLYEVKVAKKDDAENAFTVKVIASTLWDAIEKTKKYQVSEIRAHFGATKIKKSDLSWTGIEIEKDYKARPKPDFDKLINAHKERARLCSQSYVDEQFNKIYG